MSNSIPEELRNLIHNLYTPLGLKVTNELFCERESREYRACRFSLNHQNIIFRVAKTTPKKIGQFVTLWQRDLLSGNIIPFDKSDDINFVIVGIYDDNIHRGQFVFSKQILLSQNIISQNHTGGKLAFRVYPPWIKCISKQAIQTQKWQIPCFFSVGDYGNSAKLLKLFSN